MSMPPEVNIAVLEDEGPVELERPVSWRAVLAGVAVAIVVQLLLAVLGGAIGLAFIDPTRTDNPDAGTMTIVAAIWWTLSGIIAAWAGGVTAGRLSGRPGTTTAAWHGLVAWAATTLVIFYLLTTAIGGIVGGAFSALGTVASGVVTTGAGAAAAIAPAVTEAVDPFAGVETRLNDAVGADDPEAARTALIAMARAAFTADDDAEGATMDRAVDALARATGVTPDQAREQLTAWQAEYDEAVATAEAQAREAADTARTAASTAGIVSVLALVFGALAGWFGGLNSPVPDRDGLFGTRFGRRTATTG